MPKTPADMAAAIAANLPARTGRTLAEWTAALRAQDLPTFKQRVEWLKREHRLGHGQAQVVAWQLEKDGGKPEPTPEELLAAQYSGDKAALRPVYERLAALVAELGPEARLEMRQTYVSLTRGRQFGLIQATARSRVTLGLVLPGVAAGERLREAGSFGSGQVTHRVDLASPAEVDDEVAGWLRRAFAGRA